MDFTILEKIKAAVSVYGPTAPFTLTLLKSITEGWLTWAVLSGGDFVLWKSEVAESAKELEIRNCACQDTKSLTAKKIIGDPPYNTLEAQMRFLPVFLAQVCQACLTAWKKLPP